MTDTTVPAIVQTVMDEPMDFTVIANSPKEMETAQRSLILWAARKIQAIKSEMQEATNQFNICREKKWGVEGWRAQIKKQERRAEFYRKIKMALEAGYYIVPPFPIDIFAIRTKRNTPTHRTSTNSYNQDQPAQVLPPGEGRYVNPTPKNASYVEPEKQRDGSMRDVTYYYAEQFKDVGFPFKLAKAEIRDATDKAMAFEIFDQFGVLPRTRSPDPIVCGQIIVPGQSCYGDGSHRKAVTFFIAWWLDTSSL